jgi:NAD(P)-dependent dehydrogenase (short-subunit alcohol dehydrogenase family)
MDTPRTAIVTAASRGMGAACARALAEKGYALTLLARSEEVEALASELGAQAVRGTVTSVSDLQRAVDVTTAKWGRIDAVVNNTGHAAKGDLLALTDEEWMEGLELLLMNVIRMARIATPVMVGQGSGAFVNISSFSAAEAGPRFPISSVIRGALGNYTKLFSQRYAREGLRMNTILPGWIDSYPVADSDVAEIPARRAGTVAEVANVAAFLLSDDSSYVTGESLLVDGGLVRAV